jgi:hypothetical protein
MNIKTLIIAAVFLGFSCIFVTSGFSHEGENHGDTRRQLKGVYDEGSGSSTMNEYENKERQAEQAMEEGSGTMQDTQGIPASSKENYEDMKGHGENMIEKKSHDMGNNYEEGSGSIRVPTN